MRVASNEELYEEKKGTSITPEMLKHGFLTRFKSHCANHHCL